MNGMQIFFLITATTVASDDEAIFRMAVRKQLIDHEGYMCTVYNDSLGYKTVGVGHLLPYRTPMKIGEPVSIRTVETYLSTDVDRAISDARSILKEDTWAAMSLSQRLAWVDFSFNLGYNRTLQFKQTIKHLNNKEWELAGNQMLKSKWAKQVGRRSKIITDMIAGKRTA